jgi:hypothetical protein
MLLEHYDTMSTGVWVSAYLPMILLILFTLLVTALANPLPHPTPLLRDIEQLSKPFMAARRHNWTLYVRFLIIEIMPDVLSLMNPITICSD